jgi:hypothetical protein
VRQRSWLWKVFNPLLVSTMMGCIAIAVVDLLTLLAPAWSGAYIIVGCVLAALEAGYSRSLVRARKLQGNELTRFRLAEIAAILVLLKIGSYVGSSWSDIWAEISIWPTDPLAILDVETMISSLLALWSWLMVMLTMHDLERVGDPLEYDRHRVPASQAILDRMFGGGILLLIVTGITRIGLERLLDLERAPVPGMILNVLAYFLLGFVQMGQIHYLSLDRQWNTRKIKTSAKLPRRWARYSLGFLVLVALIAFLLPTGYTLGLLDVARTILGVLVYVVEFGLQLAFYLMLLIFWLLLLLLAPNRERPPLPEIEPIDPALPPSPGSVGGPDWLEMLRSFLFWTVVLGAIVYVLRTYLRDHPEIVRSLLSFGPIRFVYNILRALWRRLTHAAATISQRLPRDLLRRRRGQRGPSRDLFRFFRLGALSPRERTLYYYLSILRRAGHVGFPRRHSQTPYEYDDVLKPHLEHAQQEMDLLTDDFVEARYSPHPIDQKRESQVRTRWKRVKAAMRSLRKKQSEQE